MRYAIYMRVAHGEPDGFDTLVKQRDTLTAYAKDKGIEVVGRYWDIGVPAHDMSRPGLKGLLADYAAGKFERVLVVDMSRLTRQPVAFPFIIETVK